jgi:probable rRNA maturation factor
MKPTSAHVPQIFVRNLQRRMAVDRNALESFAERALQLCKALPQNNTSALSNLRKIYVLVVSDRKISDLHRRFMHISGPTDVITFEHGELFISAETACRQAKIFGTTFERELRLYTVHGLLHLHGFDDKTSAGAREMKRIQERILSSAA